MAYFGERNVEVGVINVYDMDGLIFMDGGRCVMFQGYRMKMVDVNIRIRDYDDVRQIGHDGWLALYNLLAIYMGMKNRDGFIMRQVDFKLARRMIPVALVYIDQLIKKYPKMEEDVIEEEVEEEKNEKTDIEMITKESHEVSRVVMAVDSTKPIVIVGADNPLRIAVENRLIVGECVDDLEEEDIEDGKGYWFYNTDIDPSYVAEETLRGYAVAVDDQYVFRAGKGFYYPCDNYHYTMFGVGYNRNKMPRRVSSSKSMGWLEGFKIDEVYAVPNARLYRIIMAKMQLGIELQWSTQSPSLVDIAPCKYDRFDTCIYDQFIYEHHWRYYDMISGIVHPNMMVKPKPYMHVIEGTFVRLMKGEAGNVRSKYNTFAVIRNKREKWVFRRIGGC